MIYFIMNKLSTKTILFSRFLRATVGVKAGRHQRRMKEVRKVYENQKWKIISFTAVLRQELYPLKSTGYSESEEEEAFILVCKKSTLLRGETSMQTTKSNARDKNTEGKATKCQ
nr:uncharacterized protein LOC102119077 [Macaca fascicularis]